MKASVLTIIVLVALFSCGDNVKMKESDLYKYPWIIPFVKDLSNLEFSGTHNIDLGTIILEYNCSNIDYRDVFEKFDYVSDSCQWIVLSKTKYGRIFSKTVSKEDKDGGLIDMNISVDTIKQRICIRIE